MDSKSFDKWTSEERINAVRLPGKTPEEIAKGYDRWSNGFEKDVTSKNYGAPAVLATTLQKYLQDKSDAKILDVGAGSGLAGEKLRDLGFTNIDALDPSQGMLEVARRKNLYKNYLCAFFTSNVDEIETNAYDALVSTGCMLEGHLKCDSLPEMIRCVKTGGVIILIGRENDMVAIAEYKDKLEPYMKQLEEEGQWTLLERTIFPGYFPNLRDLGFTNIDALDPSQGMLEVARRKNLYKNYLCAFFTSNVDEIETNAYDALVSTGCMLEGHLKCDSLPEMIRCVKTGGVIILIGRENDMVAIAEYKDKLEPYMKQLEEEGQWTLLERTIFPGYFPNVNGIIFAFRITK